MSQEKYGRRFNIRLDHIAYRVRDRDAAVKFFQEAFDFKIQDEFEIDLEDGSKAKCMSLEPSEKILPSASFECISFIPVGAMLPQAKIVYHMAPEIFVSSGPKGSLIDNWVNEWGRGIGGVHHLAYQVEDARAKMLEWQSKGWLFTTKDVLECEDLTQVFSLPNPYTGIIYEFIERKGQRGFCKANVGKLMSSTKDLNNDKKGSN